MDNLIFFIIGLILILTSVVFVMAIMLSGLRKRLVQNQKKIEQVMEEMKALYAGAAGQGGHIARIEKQVNNLSDRQEKFDSQDPTSQNYSEAIELIEAGASIEDLIKRGLRREEAELLMRMHGEKVPS